MPVDRTTAPEPSVSLEAFAALAPVRAVRVSGADRLDYLDDVLTQKLRGSSPGTVTSALFLDGHGAPLGLFDLVISTEHVLLLVPDDPEALAAVEMLASRTFLADVAFTPSTEQVLAVRAGPDALAAAGLAHDRDDAASGGETLVIRRPGGVDVIAPPGVIGDLASGLEALGITRAGTEAYEAWRIASGQPAWGREVRPPHLPEELGLLPTHVHLAKGCYPGQEAVARMWMLGRPRRRLARVVLAGDVAVGDEFGDGRDRVVVTSRQRAGEEHLGLAFVPASASAGQVFGEGDRTVTVRAFVGDDLPVQGHDPAVTRRRDRSSPRGQ